MVFEMDDRLYHNNLNLFRLTNWFIGLACALLVVWFVWELFHSLAGAFGSAIIFSLWQSTLTDVIPFRDIGMYLMIPILLLGLLPGRGGLVKAVLAAGTVAFVFRELSCWIEHMDIVHATFSFRNIAWPPGRTSTIMVLFLLPCFAGYCRFERVRKARWAVLSMISFVLALLSYEQAVVAPPALLGCAIALSFQGIKVRWQWHIMPWVIGLSYAALHKTYLHETRYTKQAYRGTTGAFRDIWAWLFPASFELKFMGAFLTPDIGFLAILVDTFWLYLVYVASNLIAYFEARKELIPALFGLLGSVGTVLPMVFQHPLSHYYYLPMVFRSIFIAWLAMIAWRGVISVVERREIPAREMPAPALH